MCCESFAEITKMREHETNHRPDPKEKCAVCQMTFDNESLCEDHYVEKHRDSCDKTFPCPQCTFKTEDVINLMAHVRLHHTGERPFICTLHLRTEIDRTLPVSTQR